MSTTISSIAYEVFVRNMAGSGVFLLVGPFVIHVQSAESQVIRNIYSLYSNHSILEQADFADFNIAIQKPKSIRRWIKPQAILDVDGSQPFKPLPLDQAYPMFEWGLNWCIANHMHHFLIFHAAVVEKNGFSIIMPGAPGKGKSTFCAALVAKGWRLLSDELALIDRETLELIPIAKPISLKNDSINIIKQYAPESIVGDISHDTVKGSVAHVKPTKLSIVNNARATPSMILFPEYKAESESVISNLTKALTMVQLIDQSFNYHILGSDGFVAVQKIVDNCKCYDLQYSEFDSAIQSVEECIV